MEVMVVIAIIGILTSVILFSISDARASARDKQRLVDLKNLELALALYYEINNEYPPQGCGATGGWTGPGVIDAEYQQPANLTDGCDEYIEGLAPVYIPALPIDPKFEDDASNPGWGYLYRTNGARSAYKVMAHLSVEKAQITSNDDEYARRSNACFNPSGADPLYGLDPFQPGVYAVYGGSDGTNDVTTDSACW